jgi:hypothetical protein
MKFFLNNKLLISGVGLRVVHELSTVVVGGGFGLVSYNDRPFAVLLVDRRGAGHHGGNRPGSMVGESRPEGVRGWPIASGVLQWQGRFSSAAVRRASVDRRQPNWRSATHWWSPTRT